ncbi:MAG TPA: hypothetical protein VJU14_10375 [Solirubrobacterales bacterium]|nr:hypothetical protein [Solirubrobacterales bacterium]
MLLKWKSADARKSRRDHGQMITDDGLIAARKEAIEKTAGMFAHLVQGRSMVDELIADRRAEARAEDLEELEEAKRRRREKN